MIPEWPITSAKTAYYHQPGSPTRTFPCITTHLEIGQSPTLPSGEVLELSSAQPQIP